MSERYQVLLGQSAEMVRSLEPGSVQCCVTSPPYFYQRDYGVDGQLGLEMWTDENGKEWADLTTFVERLVEVFAAVHDALAPDGTLWVNMGDKCAGSGGAGGDYNKAGFREGQRRFPPCRVKGIPDKNLLLVPARVALALQAWGWYVRSDIIWSKPNPPPTGVNDRPLTSHEYLFLLTKSPRYHFNCDALREQTGREASPEEWEAGKGMNSRADAARWKGYKKHSPALTHPLGRAPRSVWSVSSNRRRRDHDAAYPPGIVEPCILAGSRPGDLVLDPFSGTATTGVVALRHGRRYVGVELNPEYREASLERLREASLTPAQRARETITNELPGQQFLFGGEDEG